MNKIFLTLRSACCLFLLLAIGCGPRLNSAHSQLVAFPGAEGFGKYTTGGRGGRVITVTNLNDEGPGSLRAAIRAKGPRIVVFGVSGTIELRSALDINNGDITIAGQSAPGDGICIRNYATHVKADNVIIRYLRFRLGDESAEEDDAMNGMNHKNIIIDHCSFSWSVDECVSFYHNSNFTMQWCMVSESLNNSVHEKGPHGYGGIWGGTGASFHHNLITSHNSRNPRFSGSSTTMNTEDELVDFSNNVIFNWGSNSIYGGEGGKYNLVNNYFKPGPATAKKVSGRIVNPSQPYGRFYVDGNIMEGDETVSSDNWKGGVQCEHPDSTRARRPFAVDEIPKQTAQSAYAAVLAGAGASFKRDATDERIVRELTIGKPGAGKQSNGLIDSQKEVGGWPLLNGEAAEPDTDGDGIPDAWESAHGLNPNDPKDNQQALKGEVYPAIEAYLNSLLTNKTRS